MEIDFHRIVESVKDEIEFGKVLMMSEERRREYFKGKQQATERRFYEEGGPTNSNRQLYMMKMITTPLIENRAMGHLERITRLGNGYQPAPDTPIVFKPEDDRHVSMYYKSKELFKMEFRDADGNTHAPSGLKSYQIANNEAKHVLASISNDEWNKVADKVVTGILDDTKRNEMDVMMSKTDTDYIRGSNPSGFAQYMTEPAKPSVRDRVNSMSDEELQRMFEASMRTAGGQSSSSQFDLER